MQLLRIEINAWIAQQKSRKETAYNIKTYATYITTNRKYFSDEVKIDAD